MTMQIRRYAATRLGTGYEILGQRNMKENRSRRRVDAIGLYINIYICGSGDAGSIRASA